MVRSATSRSFIVIKYRNQKSAYLFTKHERRDVQYLVCHFPIRWSTNIEDAIKLPFKVEIHEEFSNMYEDWTIQCVSQ